MEKLLNIIARIFNKIPECLARFICIFCGYGLYIFLPSRRHIVLKNLHIVFPEKSSTWLHKIARIHCCRWAETVWLFLTGSTWNREKIQQRFSVSPALRDWIATFEVSKKSAVVLVPHLNLMETMTWIPAFFDHFPNTGVVYRPFRSKWFENWIRITRERFGLQLISRKRGIMPLEKILKNNGIISILFDQSAGETGCLTTFFKRLASCTDLPGRLVEKYGSEVVAIYLRRTGFLTGELCIEKISCSPNTLSVTMEANRWLEDHLEKNPSFYENWLWMHRRWKIQHWPLRRFNIFQKRNLLEETCAYFHWTQLPRKTDVWIRMPDKLSDSIAILPLLKALRKARPDFYMHLLCCKTFAPWLQRNASVDLIHTLPSKSGWGYFKQFLGISKDYPDLWINFSDTLKSDLEAYLSGAPQRFGMRKHRFLLNHVFNASDPAQDNLTLIGYNFLQAFGLKEPLEQEYRPTKVKQNVKTFGCFLKKPSCSVEPSPNDFWQQLMRLILKKFPELNGVLLDADQNRLQNLQMSLDLPQNRIHLQQTSSLLQLETVLKSLDFLVTDDGDTMAIGGYLGITTFFIGLEPTSPFKGSENVHFISYTGQDPTNPSAHFVFEQIANKL